MRDKPIVVLSNNDGRVVAANVAAKRLDPGIMFKPYFKIKSWALVKGVAVRSSNCELYGAVSNRISETISRYSAWQEDYSVDESFAEIGVLNLARCADEQMDRTLDSIQVANI